MKKPLFITGMPGSGKTTIGKLVAYDLSLPFYDLDKLIESAEKKTIATIFSEKGEDYFRKIENEILLDFLKKNENEIYILALGGGTICFFDSLIKLKQTGVIIYLETEIEQLLNQLSNSNGTRPLLGSSEESGFRLRIETLLEKRKSFYTKANFIIQSNTDKHITMADIVEIMEK